jgi:hypothetical protein
VIEGFQAIRLSGGVTVAWIAIIPVAGGAVIVRIAIPIAVVIGIAVAVVVVVIGSRRKSAPKKECPSVRGHAAFADRERRYSARPGD